MLVSKTQSKRSNYSNIFQTDNQIRPQTDFKPPSQKHKIYQQLQRKFTSAFFEDHNQEEYVIHRAFNTNNFTYLRKLPDNIKHGDILNQRKQKVTQHTLNQTLNRTKDFPSKLIERQSKISQKRKQQIGTLGYFTPFEYKQSNYQMPKILDSLDRITNEQKRKQISQLNFRPSGIQAKMKYQDPFKFVDKSKGFYSQTQIDEYIYPFHLPQDTYDSYHQSELRRRVISESLRIDGDFIPAKKQQTLTKVNKHKLGEILNEMELFLKKYLEGIGFFIGVTANDHIEVLFEDKHKQNNKISLIMSKICEHQLISKYILRRNHFKWNLHDQKKGYLVYCLLPNWVKNPPEKLKR